MPVLISTIANRIQQFANRKLPRVYHLPHKNNRPCCGFPYEIEERTVYINDRCGRRHRGGANNYHSSGGGFSALLICLNEGLMQNIGNIKLKITYVTKVCIIRIKSNAHTEAGKIIIQVTLVFILEPGQVNLHLCCAS